MDVFLLRMDQWVQVSREAWGATYPEQDTTARLSAPTHFVKVDLGILPVADYVHIGTFVICQEH